MPANRRVLAPVEVVLDWFLADRQCPGDLPVALSLEDVSQDLLLAGR